MERLEIITPNKSKVVVINQGEDAPICNLHDACAAINVYIFISHDMEEERAMAEILRTINSGEDELKMDDSDLFDCPHHVSHFVDVYSDDDDDEMEEICDDLPLEALPIMVGMGSNIKTNETSLFLHKNFNQIIQVAVENRNAAQFNNINDMEQFNDEFIKPLPPPPPPPPTKREWDEHRIVIDKSPTNQNVVSNLESIKKDRNIDNTEKYAAGNFNNLMLDHNYCTKKKQPLASDFLSTLTYK